MNDRKDRGRDRAPAPPATETPAADDLPLDTVHEPAPSSRWEGEGGAAVEPPPVPGAGAPPADDFKDRWLRAEADLQNYRRRASREWDEARRGAEEAVLLEMVGTLDDLERAIESATAAGADPGWVQGVAHVGQRLRDYLGRQGVIAVDPLGQPFDPAFHEALLEMESEDAKDEGQIVKVVQKGYRRGDRSLRAARVVVGRPAGSRG